MSKTLHKKKTELQKTTLLVSEEKENNNALENYTRRANLKFMNVPEHRGEDCKGKIINLITKRSANRYHISDSMPFTEWESPQLVKSGQLLPDLCVAKTEIWFGQEKET